MQVLRLLFLGGVWMVAPALGQTNHTRPNSLDPGSGMVAHSAQARKQKQHVGRLRVLGGTRTRGRKTNIRHTAQYEFYERVERAARLRKKILIEQSRRPRSDFGHRRTPRKRPPHKMRYCNECGIRH